MGSPVVDFVNSESEKLFSLKEHALIGISPFNSYYNEENLKQLFSWGMVNFKEIIICIPDGASTYTLQAIGYSKNEADKKTRKHDKNLKNKAIRALMANNLSETEARNKIVLFSILKDNQKYIEFYEIYRKLYNNDLSFKEGCLSASERVLASKGAVGTVSKESLDVAAEYLLEELPVYLNTPEILNVNSSLFVYKSLPFNFLRAIYNLASQFSYLLSSGQGCISVKFI
jgi:cyclo(L-tyrosyl-L-tyrosyl) synthase